MAQVPQSSPAQFIIEPASSIHAMPEPPPTDDLVLAESEPTPLPESALIPLPPAAPPPPPVVPREVQPGLQTPPTAPSQWPPEPTAPPPPRALDLGSAVLGSKAWESAIGEPEPQASTDLCPNLAELRFDASRISKDITIDVPRTPPPPPERIGPPAMEKTDCSRALPEIVHTRDLTGSSSRSVGAPSVTGVSERTAAPRRASSAPRAVLSARKIKECSRTEDLPSSPIAAPRAPTPSAATRAPRAPSRVPTPAPRAPSRAPAPAPTPRDELPRAICDTPAPDRGTQSMRPPRTRDLPGAQHRKAEAFYQEALKSMAAHDYPGADRHLTVALTFAPGDPRYITARQKVRRVLNL